MSLKEKIGISADTTIDLKPNLLKEKEIHTVPLHIIDNTSGISYFDGELTNEDLFLLADKHKITTSAPNVQAYTEHFEKLLKDNEYLLHFNISSELSASHQNAIIARNELSNPNRIKVINTYNCTIGSGLILLNALDHIQNVDDFETLLNEIQSDISNTDLCVILSTLKYVLLGGRLRTALGEKIGSVAEKTVATPFATTLEKFRVRPIISMKDGKPEMTDKDRGSTEKVSNQAFNEILNDEDTDLNRVLFAATNSDAESSLVKIANNLDVAGNINEIHYSTAGQVISNHSGPNAYAVAYMKKRKKA